MAPGTTLLDAARKADIHINASCNGKGSCGKCKPILEAGTVDEETSPLLTDQEKENNYLLACQAKITGDVSVAIPPEAIEKKLKVAGLGDELSAHFKGLVGPIEPMLKEMQLDMAPPTLDDFVSDLDRLNRGLKKAGCDVRTQQAGGLRR